jgi:hypothetical protein
MKRFGEFLQKIPAGDNYTSVLAALGASIAAGAGVAVHDRVKQLHARHDAMQKSLDELHAKVDKLAEK